MNDPFGIRETTFMVADEREPEGCEICGHCRLLRSLLRAREQEPGMKNGQGSLTARPFTLLDAPGRSDR